MLIRWTERMQTLEDNRPPQPHLHRRYSIEHANRDNQRQEGVLGQDGRIDRQLRHHLHGWKLV